MDDPFIGQVRLFASQLAPEGWVQCQGQTLVISEYTGLFSILKAAYGGDGETTFALPDLRGRVPIGAGQGLGLDAIALGQTTGSATVQAGHEVYGPPVIGLNWCIAIVGVYPGRA